jgi:long-chain acyl-CoA synthetase
MYGERRITNKLNYHTLSTIRHRIIRSFIKPLHVLFYNTLYKKIKNTVGLGNIRASISGGGALSMQDELFYDAIGINLRIGYGLTETAPVLTLRNVTNKNYLGSAGTPVEGTDLKVVDPKTFEELPRFQKGLVIVKGPQIMKGYYKDEEATRKVFTEDGYFITGDLGWLTKQNNLVLVGRLKETIVLSSGENVEPVPIEEAILLSPYIDQIVLVGQDKSGIGALIVPSKEALEKCGINMKDVHSYKDINTFANPDLENLIKNEINTHIVKKPNLRVFEKVKQFTLLKESFSVENGLMSATQKVKRNKVFEKYEDVIGSMYNK